MKLGGALLLFGCGGAWVGIQNRDERAKMIQVAAFAELFAEIGVKIESLCLPLDEILASLSPALLSACGIGAENMAALTAAMARVSDSEAADILRETGAQLGRGTSVDQIRLCRAAAERLRQRHEQMVAAGKNNARARMTLVMSAVLGLIILLW